MRNKTGTPVRKGDFLNREEDVRELWHQAERGHVLMLAARRVGKTSLLLHLKDSPQEGWSCFFLSAEALESEAQFVARFLEVLAEAHPDGAWVDRLGVKTKRILKGVRTKAGPLELDLTEALRDGWREEGAVALKVMRELRGNTLILVDEFPNLVRNLHGRADSPEGRHRTKLFLDWFREVRNAHTDGSNPIHFILTGSLGLDVVVKAAGLSRTINDLTVFSLGPLMADLPRELLRRLSEGEGLVLPVPVEERILKLIDWPIPFNLQLLFSEVLKRAKFGRSPKPLTESLVQEAYEFLLSPAMDKHFSHWVERLDDPFEKPQERDLKRGLLRAAARDRNGLSRSSIQQLRVALAPDVDANTILLGLDRDGYLAYRDGRWRFASSLLRDWWRKWQLNERT